MVWQNMVCAYAVRVIEWSDDLCCRVFVRCVCACVFACLFGCLNVYVVMCLRV